MHSKADYQEALQAAGFEDCWAPTLLELGILAQKVLGKTESDWVRSKGDTAEIGIRREPGSRAEMLLVEMTKLAALTQSIRNSKRTNADVEAAAFFHLRFEAIHPLKDGNGRVGRIILAIQCANFGTIRSQEFLRQIHVFENDYKWVFASGNEQFHFELLVDLLCRILGVEQSESFVKVPFSLMPTIPINSAKKPMTFREIVKPQASAFWRRVR
jgi:hypothetical protein